MHCDKQRQQGLAVVEFAIILPFVVLVAFAVAELGRGLYQYNTLNKAVRDGVRYLSDVAIQPGGTIDIDSYRTQMKNLVVCGDIDGCSSGSELLPGWSTDKVDAVAVPVTLISGGPTINHIEVTATYTFDPLFDALAIGYSKIPDMSVTVTQRALRL